MSKIIQINTSLSTLDGGTVDAGAIVLFSVGFPIKEMSYSASFQIFRNLNALLNGANPINNLSNFKNIIKFTPSEIEFNALTPLTIYENIRTALGVIYGDSNVIIIDLPISGT